MTPIDSRCRFGRRSVEASRLQTQIGPRRGAWSWAPVVLVASFVLVACGRSETREADSVVTGSADERFIADSLTDWVSFADQVSVVQVIAERELPRAPGSAVSEGYLARQIDLKITSSVWSRGTPRASGVISIPAWGWILHDGKPQRFTVEGAPWVEVGQTLILPLVELDGVGWSMLATTAAFRLDANGAVLADTGRVQSSALRELAGRTPDEVRVRLATVPQYPEVAAHPDLAPAERQRLVLERLSAAPSSTGTPTAAP
jgi:hypothetical protein